MEKIIEIDLLKEEDFKEKYNRKKVARELINYLAQKTMLVSSDDKIKLVINNYLSIEVANFLKEGFQDELEKNFYEAKKNNFFEIMYFLGGVSALFISTLIERTIFKEIILIGGWVLIWQVVELEIFSDINNRKRRRALKRLLNCEIVENKL